MSRHNRKIGLFSRFKISSVVVLLCSVAVPQYTLAHGGGGGHGGGHGGGGGHSGGGGHGGGGGHSGGGGHGGGGGHSGGGGHGGSHSSYGGSFHGSSYGGSSYHGGGSNGVSYYGGSSHGATSANRANYSQAYRPFHSAELSSRYYDHWHYHANPDYGYGWNGTNTDNVTNPLYRYPGQDIQQANNQYKVEQATAELQEDQSQLAQSEQKFQAFETTAQQYQQSLAARIRTYRGIRNEVEQKLRLSHNPQEMAKLREWLKEEAKIESDAGKYIAVENAWLKHEQQNANNAAYNMSEDQQRINDYSQMH